MDIKIGDKVRVYSYCGKISSIEYVPNEARYLIRVDFGSRGQGRVYSSDVNKTWIPLRKSN